MNSYAHARSPNQVHNEPSRIKFWVPDPLGTYRPLRMCAHFNEESAVWESDAGCYPDYGLSNDTHTLCQCNHLTTFASLNSLDATAQVCCGLPIYQSVLTACYQTMIFFARVEFHIYIYIMFLHEAWCLFGCDHIQGNTRLVYVNITSAPPTGLRDGAQPPCHLGHHLHLAGHDEHRPHRLPLAPPERHVRPQPPSQHQGRTALPICRGTGSQQTCPEICCPAAVRFVHQHKQQQRGRG